MFRALVGLLCVIACLHTSFIARRAEASGTQSISPASRVYLNQSAIINSMRHSFPDVEVNVVWKPCGEYNAFYYAGSKTIVLCTEMEAFPDAAVFFAAHEMGHAITHQLLSELNEADADELAALALIEDDQATLLAKAGLYWKVKSFQGHIKNDPHPSAGYRAWFLVCMAAGLDSPGECQDLLEITAWKWQLRLQDYH